MTGDYNLKITHARGKAIPTKYGLVLPTYHPAAILRGYSDFPKLVADFKYARELIGGVPAKHPGESKYLLATHENIDKLTRKLTQYDFLAADIETSGFSPRYDRILSVAVAWEKNKVAIFPDSILHHPAFKWLMEYYSGHWIWHNGKFDASFLWSLGIRVRVDDDTMLMHYCLDENRGTHDLKQLAGDLLGAPDYKDALRPYLHRVSDSFENVPRNVLYRYQAKDADYTLQLYPILRKRLDKDPGLVRLYEELLIPASAFLQRVERAGVWVAQDYLDALEADLAERQEKAHKAILDVVSPYWDAEQYVRDVGAKSIPAEFNPGSPKQLLWALHKEPNGAGRNYSTTNAAVLKDLKQTPLITNLKTYRQMGKALSTYVHGVRDEIEKDGRVHTTYLLHGTTTGRLSSRGPNMQNIPRSAKIRNVFQAPPGRVLVEMDYSQIELRILAYLSNDRFLWSVYEKGRDLHDEVAAALFGPGFTKEQRIRAKFVNFGIAYGRGAGSIANEFNIEFAEASQMIKGWFRRAPQAAQYIKECRQAPILGKTLSSPFGRKRRFGLITAENRNTIENEAVNFPMQSTASDITLTFAMRIDTELRSRWGAAVINLIHDSILIELPEHKDIDGMIRWVRDQMIRHPQEVLNTELPFDVSVSRGRLWGYVSDPKQDPDYKD